MIGIGYRRELAGWIRTGPPGVECLELTAEHFYSGAEQLLPELRARYRILMHSLDLSLGTPGPLDPERLNRFARLVALANPEWISEHVAFTRTGEFDLGHLNPLRPTRAIADTVAAHAKEIQERCGKPLLLENITSHLQLRGELSEPEFLNTVCHKADCGLLLDVTNLYINSRNHNFDPLSWVEAVDTSRIWQMHLVGYSQKDGHWTDDHAEPIQGELLDLARAIAARAPVRAIILERDAAFPPANLMQQEIEKLRSVFARN